MKNILKGVCIFILFIIALFIQLFVFDNMQLFGVKPNLILICIIVVGLYTNIYSSVIFSFFVGLIVDLLFGSSGMFVISYTVVGMLLGYINGDYIKENYLSVILITVLSVTLFEVVQYVQSMIILSQYISFIFLIKQLILSILLNTILVFIICFIFGKIVSLIDRKQNKLYW